jgi:tetratricopeptide (TPR) repeat protein
MKRGASLLFLYSPKLSYIFLILILGTPQIAYTQTIVGKLVSLQGVVEISRDRGTTWEKAKPFQTLYGGDLLRTGHSSRAAILFIDETQIKMNEYTLFLVKEVIPPHAKVVPAKLEKPGQSTYRIFKGELWFRIKREQVRPIIETPTVSASIRGTEFNLSVKEDGESILSVLEGLVEYYNEFGSILVYSNEQAIVLPGHPPTKSILLQPQDAVQWSFYYPGIISYRDYFFISPDPQQLEKKLKEVKEKLFLSPQESELQILLAHLLHDLGMRREAKAEYEKVLSVSPKDPMALTGLGWIYLEMNQPAQAIIQFQLVHPQNVRSILGSSLALYRQGKMAEAVEEVKDGIAEFEMEPHLLTQLAFFYMLLGKSNEAIQNLEEAIRVDPGFSLAYGFLSNLFLTQNRKGEALENAKRALQANPFSPTAHINLSLTAQSNFDIPKAIEQAKEAVKLDPENIRAMVQLAQLLFGSDRREEAKSWVAKALIIDPEDSQVHTLCGFLSLACRETDPAIRSFERAIELDSTQGEPHLGLGIALIRKRQVDRGLEEMLMATLLEPRRALFQSYLGKALYETRRFKESLGILEQAKSLDPNDPTPYLYSSIIYSDLNQPGRAIQELHQSIDLNDHRAVYRSRFLLDQDLSVKNAYLAKAYALMGVNAWARSKALWSLKDDPSNSAAHFFFGAAIEALGESGQSASSELLKRRLLMPVNENSFNSFNDYTSFFDKPDLKATVEGVGGTDHLQDYSLLASGGTNRSAFRQLASYFKSEGVHTENDEKESFLSISLLKYQVAVDHSLMFSALYSRRVEGDTSGDNDYKYINDPDYEFKSRVIQWELGYHYHIGPRSDLLIYGMWTPHYDLNYDDPGVIGGVFPYFWTTKYRLPSKNAQIIHQLGWRGHQLFYGFEYFGGENGVKDHFGVPDLAFDMLYREKIDQKFMSGFIQDSWRIFPNFILEGTLRYERGKDGDPYYSDQEFSIWQWSPGLGLIYRPMPSTLLRLGGARFLQTPANYDARLSTGEIGGFTSLFGPLRENEFPLSKNWEVDFAWDQEIYKNLFLTASAFLRERKSYYIDWIDSKFEFTKRGVLLHGCKLIYNQIWRERWGISFEYKFLNIRDKEYQNGLLGVSIPYREAQDHQFKLGLRYVHPTGWKFGISETYIYQHLSRNYAEESPSDFFITDFFISYELPKKWGEIAFKVENLFDRKFQLSTREWFLDDREPMRRVSLGLKINF